VLDAPGNNEQSGDKYSGQLCVSWPSREGFFNNGPSIDIPATDEARSALIKTFAATWAEPFRSLALSIPTGTEVKQVDLSDWPPPKGLRGSGPVMLMGDAFHPMAMCKQIVFYSRPTWSFKILTMRRSGRRCQPRYRRRAGFCENSCALSVNSWI
jgi:hypothetical protein